tara:strand:- start:846 stop:3116 length:2271 start_codon:yes stop_codon:yes gene_type:complete
MQRLQLYIENNQSQEVLIDLFDNETIQLTSTIQDVKDIGKVFTDFSQTFSVPASETNNKVFRHFYNFNITGNAFDARKKRKALLHINYAPFREGKIFLNSVKMKNNKAYAYEVIFYGKTVSLKDLIGDDELTNLTYLKNYNHEFSQTNVKNGLKDGLDFTVDNTGTGASSTSTSTSQTDAVIYPLITSKKRLFYNSDTSGTDFDFNGNLHYRNSSGNGGRGLEFTDLKPAIKLKHIIEAIEKKYSEITFTRDFFSDSNAVFSNLYFWINSKNGELDETDDDEGYVFSKILTGLNPSSSAHPFTTISGSDISISLIAQISLTLKATFTVNDAAIPYDIIVRNTVTGDETVTSTKGNQSQKIISLISNASGINSQQNLEIEVKSKSEITLSSIVINITTVSLGNNINTADYNISGSLVTSFEILLEQMLPKMSVLDFLTGLFKMFNLTAYFIDDYGDAEYGKIYVDTLDNYYADSVNNKLGGLIDIDKYLDASQHTVNSILPFTDINFKYSENDTILMEHHFEKFNEVFGDAEFNVREATRDSSTNEITLDRGRKYDIDIPFAHFKYERMIDTGAASTVTDVQWGYCAGGNFNSDTSASPKIGDYENTLTDPLIFYAIQESSSSTPIAFINSSSSSEQINQYFRPSNANESGSVSTPPTATLNFDSETDEWNRVNYGLTSNSLYNKFYKSYVESVFNPLKRIFKVRAFLPPNIVINYRLNDQIKIQDKIFRINSITTNLMTGESELELLNIFSSEIVG